MRRWWQIVIVFGASLVLPGRAQDATLPDVTVVLEKVLDQARHERVNDRSFRSHYAYLRTRTNRELDSSGRVKNEETKQSRNNPSIVPMGYVRPSPPVSSLNQTNRQTPQAGQGKAFDKNDFVLNDDLVSRFDFTLVKREQVNGRDA